MIESSMHTWYGNIDDIGFFAHDLSDPDALVQNIRTNRIPTDIEGIDIRQFALDKGIFATEDDYIKALRTITITRAKHLVKESIGPDQLIISGIKTLDDTNEVTNMLAERLVEWYGLHFPEIKLSGEELAVFVAQTCSRNNIEAGDPLYEISTKSMGCSIGKSDEDILKNTALTLEKLYADRAKLEDYINNSMQELAPNLSKIAGGLLGARLIAKLGGIKKVAEVSSSTIQVIGADNAMFKHLHGKATSPKHGLIFSHPKINTAKWWLRGKIARAFASTVSKAVRVDYYSGNIMENLESDLDATIAHIEKKYPNPPVGKGKVKESGKGQVKGKKGSRDNKGHGKRNAKNTNESEQRGT